LGVKTSADDAVRNHVKTTLRASARILALNLAALAGVLTVSAAGIPAPEAPAQDVIAAQGVVVGDGYAIQAGRITAAAGADFAFDTPSISVAEKVAPVAVSHRRAVSHNPAPPSVAGNAVLEEAAKYVGTPYRAGGSTPAGFDCSGFVSYVFRALGVSLPRSSAAYWNVGTRVSAADARPGDLIVSSGHVAIYAGGSMQIDSPRPGKTVQFRQIWQSSYVFVRVG
jgi:cell wall-associated NlpC family hydrolase